MGRSSSITRPTSSGGFASWACACGAWWSSPDEIEDVAHTVRAASERHDVVCTTGGVGPTHDDITMGAIARAWGMPLVSNPLLEAVVRRHFGDRTDQGHLRMALVPEGSVLVGGPGPPWPTVLFHNVYVLPGIPPS